MNATRRTALLPIALPSIAHAQPTVRDAAEQKHIRCVPLHCGGRAEESARVLAISPVAL